VPVPLDRKTQLPEVEVRAPAEDHEDRGREAVELDREPLSQQSLFAFFSSQKRNGEWEPADRIEVSALFGDVRLDFRDALLPPSGIVEVRATVLFGTVELLVPDGSEVEMEGTPIFGSFERKQPGRRALERIREWITGEQPEDCDDEYEDEPALFRVTGLAIFGDVRVRGR